MFKGIKRAIEFPRVAMAVVAYVVFVFLNNIGADGQPFSAGLYFAMLLSGYSVIGSGLLFLLSQVFTFSLGGIVSSSACALVLSVIYGIFGKIKKFGLPSAVFLLASLIPYIIMGGESDYLPRLITAVLITFLGVAIYPAVKAVKVKGFRRAETYEVFSLSLLYVCLWLGGIKYVGGDIYKAFCVFVLIVVSTLRSGSESCLVAFVLAMPVAIDRRSATAFAPYLLYGGISFMFAGKNKIAYAVMMVFAELIAAYIFKWYGDYGYTNFIYFVAPLVATLPLPKRFFKRGEQALAISADKPLSRNAINRARTLVSGRLYEISGTFREISDLFETLSKKDNPFAYEDAIIEETHKICEGCSFFAKCKANNFPTREELARLIAIAKGKGRLTNVDLPKKFSEKCSQTGKILFAVNKYVNLYSAEMEKHRAAEETRELVGLQANGVAAALKGMAKAMSKTLSFRTEKESKLCGFLLKRGVNAQEVMILGEGENAEIHITLVGNEDNITPYVNEFFRAKFICSERFDLPDGRIVLIMERACKYDCVFGVSTMRKNGENACGDTHSLIKISRNKFMLALSDGMGSGETAKATSASSLSLIECFYRAGLPGEIALSTVNRLLSFAGEDNFAALDLAIINLESLCCDFVKLGAPYGFIISKGTVRLIEGSSLPMGILNELKPSVCTENISVGDVIVFLSDGVTDAFGSATDFADFLISANTANPQKLADNILERAFALYGNTAGDDMTVVACKIFSA